MTPSWTVVILVGAATVAIKAAGPVLLANRPLPSRLQSVLKLLPAALLAALVATQVFAHGAGLTVDTRVGGLCTAAIGAYLRVPPFLVLVAAAAVTATLRIPT